MAMFLIKNGFLLVNLLSEFFFFICIYVSSPRLSCCLRVMEVVFSTGRRRMFTSGATKRDAGVEIYFILVSILLPYGTVKSFLVVNTRVEALKTLINF